MEDLQNFGVIDRKNLALVLLTLEEVSKMRVFSVLTLLSAIFVLNQILIP